MACDPGLLWDTIQGGRPDTHNAIGVWGKLHRLPAGMHPLLESLLE